MEKSHNRKKTESRIEFGKRLRYIRREQKITIEALAEKAGLATSYVASVERGERNLGLENIIALAQALNVSPSELLPGIHHKKRDQTRTEFGKHLQYLREKRELTIEMLAERTAIDPHTLILLEQGEGNLSFDTIIILTQALNISLKELMPRYKK